MITKEEAIELIRADLDEEMDVVADSIIERDYGWVIFSQTKKYIETRNTLYMTVGSGGVLVEKATGRKIRFGSAYSTERSLEVYEKGYFEHNSWDIVVTRVYDIQKTVEILRKLGISYVKPEEVHGTVWEIPKEYTFKQFKSKLSRLPVRFNIGSAYFKFDVLESLKNQKEFTYFIEGNQSFVNDI
nr:YrhB domain-containing protein [uncultured Desulfobacter sp.]